MPENGIKYISKDLLLTYEEIHRIVSIMASVGVSKIRLTGGEPFVRNDIMQLITRLIEVPGVKDLHITTNGVLTAPFIPRLKKLGIASVNLSMDTLNKERFKLITRRNEFEQTGRTLQLLLEHHIPLKINAVVMQDKNIDDIIPLIELTRNNNIEVRFIEEMPFNGEGTHYTSLHWTYTKILNYIKQHHADLQKVADPAHSTAYNYQVPGYKGKIGIIAAFSRTFCGTCNRIRITAQGDLKTCLYDNGVLNIKSLLRAGKSDEEVKIKLLEAFNNRPKDGFEAENSRTTKDSIHESMSTIGG